MTKIKLAEIWSIAKDEPIFRWTALFVIVIGLIWLGINVPPHVRGFVRSIDRRPIPDKTAVYRLENGHCISFASLPEDWKQGRGSIFGSSSGNPSSGVAIWRNIGGISFDSVMTFTDDKPLHAKWVTDRRLPMLDAPPYKAWRGDDGAIIYLNGDKEDYTRYFWCSDPVFGSRKQRQTLTCDLYEDQTSPPGISFSVSFPFKLMSNADPLISESKAVLVSLERSCDGAIAPPR